MNLDFLHRKKMPLKTRNGENGSTRDQKIPKDASFDAFQNLVRQLKNFLSNANGRPSNIHIRINIE